MASLSLQDHAGRKGWRVRFRDVAKRQKSIWLGDIAEHIARETFAHVEHLVDCVRDGLPPSAITTRWLASADSKLRNKLATAGLCESVEERHARDITLAAWVDEYIAENNFTHCTYHQTRDNLVDHFGRKKRLRDVTLADAKKFRVWLSTSGKRRTTSNDKSLAEATVRKRTQVCKQYFNEAVERGYIDSNPFAKLKSGSVANPDRQFFVTHDMTQRCIEAAPCGDWRTIIALCRFGGLRCPSEVLRLRWRDVDLPNGRLTVDSTKTGARVCPIFRELRPFFEQAWDAAPDGADYVITRYRSATQNLRTSFQRIIRRAGLVPWERLFHNLRASRETELLGEFPAADVVSWLGNSIPVAMAHYAMARDETFQRAAGLGGHTGGHIMGQDGSSPDITAVEKPARKALVTSCDGHGSGIEYTPLDSNQ